jgi:ribosomal protein S18 acetylase RimI-like enzyme
VRIRRLEPADIPWVAKIVADHFGSARVVSRGRLHISTELPGLVAEDETGRIGLIQWRAVGDAWEIVILISLKRRHQVATRLIRAAEGLAANASCRRLWLITTNNNHPAIEFYKSAGWEQIAVHKGAVAAARNLKPEIPLRDEQGVPIEDEIEFERVLTRQG